MKDRDDHSHTYLARFEPGAFQAPHFQKNFIPDTKPPTSFSTSVMADETAQLKPTIENLDGTNYQVWKKWDLRGNFKMLLLWTIGIYPECLLQQISSREAGMDKRG